MHHTRLRCCAGTLEVYFGTRYLLLMCKYDLLMSDYTGTLLPVGQLLCWQAVVLYLVSTRIGAVQQGVIKDGSIRIMRALVLVRPLPSKPWYVPGTIIVSHQAIAVTTEYHNTPYVTLFVMYTLTIVALLRFGLWWRSTSIQVRRASQQAVHRSSWGRISVCGVIPCTVLRIHGASFNLPSSSCGACLSSFYGE